ncbi:ubiquinone/menaquinone biosynthesis methyltransferase UbiE [Haloferax mucosum ATCC BAA-1512]|uniref:Ubiquinone/menaquinone biosynthesis methyltransferase UbiE n=1 Tax=Haloferax mucosum ATCC BAA-1512 TaxID=662479 RepID=M0I7S7_9EURY|nr:class I SAM-dependent methyltransferase [Haloferax mucosum]ELZ92880.1 ubiquinone/menaquinone biosynthesis methyltransferase UbiE [Haloferax mucosum ATCC BAA-1512]
MSEQRRAVRDGYDGLADDYLANRSGEPASVLTALTAHLDSGMRVLDAGCGQGTPVTDTLSSDFDVVGVDFSREQLRLARDHVTDAALVQGDMTHLPVESSAFDAVCAFYSIIHVPVEEHERVFEEFARVLRPGGYLLSTVGDEAWEGSNPDWLDSGIEMQWSFPSIEETNELLTQSGFTVLDTFVVDDRLGSQYPFVLARYDGDRVR